MKNNIKKLRIEHKLKQEDIGEIISKSQQSVSRLEKEKRDIEIYELCTLADYLMYLLIIYLVELKTRLHQILQVLLNHC